MPVDYEHLLKDNKKIQVDSAIRDGNGVKIDTNYEKLFGHSDFDNSDTVDLGNIDSQFTSLDAIYTYLVNNYTKTFFGRVGTGDGGRCVNLITQLGTPGFSDFSYVHVIIRTITKGQTNSSATNYQKYFGFEVQCIHTTQNYYAVGYLFKRNGNVFFSDWEYINRLTDYAQPLVKAANAIEIDYSQLSADPSIGEFAEYFKTNYPKVFKDWSGYASENQTKFCEKFGKAFPNYGGHNYVRTYIFPKTFSTGSWTVTFEIFAVDQFSKDIATGYLRAYVDPNNNQNSLYYWTGWTDVSNNNFKKLNKWWVGIDSSSNCVGWYKFLTVNRNHTNGIINLTINVVNNSEKANINANGIFNIYCSWSGSGAPTNCKITWVERYILYEHSIIGVINGSSVDFYCYIQPYNLEYNYNYTHGTYSFEILSNSSKADLNIASFNIVESHNGPLTTAPVADYEAEDSLLPNKNLLYNAECYINERGSSSYSGGGWNYYVTNIDGWFCIGGGNITPNDGNGFKISGYDGNYYNVTSIEGLLDKPLTASIRFRKDNISALHLNIIAFDTIPSSNSVPISSDIIHRKELLQTNNITQFTSLTFYPDLYKYKTGISYSANSVVVYEGKLYLIDAITAEANTQWSDITIIREYKYIGIGFYIPNNTAPRYVKYVKLEIGETATKDNVYDKTDCLNMYPVGSIYISIKNKSPSMLFGGTWTQLDAGYTLWTASSGAGNTIAAGLPNIKGSFASLRTWSYTDPSGAFSTSSNTNGPNGNVDTGRIVNFNAHSYNSIYSDDVTTVQPPAYKVYMWRRIS